MLIPQVLGLDGSLAFLEHAFWVISLNALFMYIFGYIPHKIGKGLLLLCNYSSETLTTSQHLNGIIVILIGYCLIAVCLVLLHGLASLTRARKSARMLGMFYVIVKVSLLTVIEVGIFPLVCGCWLDICSLVRITVPI